MSDRFLFSLEQALLDSSAFCETPVPVLGASGSPLFYFMNTEKLLPDGGKWENYGNDSAGMINHACEYLEDERFGSTLRLLAEKIRTCAQNFPDKDWCISGFQRRDWIFSGPVARLLGRPHLSIYKDSHTEWIKHPGDKSCLPTEAPKIAGRSFVHVSDLLTRGSSAVNGWIPLLKSKQAKICAFFNIVDRMEGGKKNLGNQDFESIALFEMNENFLKKHTQNCELCTAYFQNPKKTAGDYLRKTGATTFLPFFDPHPANKKIKRALIFWNGYGNYLSPAQKEEFQFAYLEKYGQKFCVPTSQKSE